MMKFFSKETKENRWKLDGGSVKCQITVKSLNTEPSDFQREVNLDITSLYSILDKINSSKGNFVAKREYSCNNKGMQCTEEVSVDVKNAQKIMDGLLDLSQYGSDNFNKDTLKIKCKFIGEDFRDLLNKSPSP